MHAPDGARPGQLAANVMHFARLLRGAGMPVGTDRVLLALQALQVAGLGSRTDFHAVLAACLIDRAEHRLLFDQAFELFWRDPDLTGRMQAMLLPQVRVREGLAPESENRRLAEALAPPAAPPPPPEAPPPEAQLQIDAELTWNQRELLRRTDFESMSADEWRQAKRLLARMRPVFEPLPTRRTRAARHGGRGGRADWRATMAAMARHGGELWDMRWRQRRTRPAPLVLLADISGSMSRYSRMLLHFGHALANGPGGHGGRPRVESFVFGTRLTRITRQLRGRDPDLALSLVSGAVPDWAGGTRITDCLHEFNRRWARRVLGGTATLLLVTDGLEHGDPSALAFEMERLHKSCRRLLWLNPLLRFDRFEPRAGGIKAMLPHVDRFLPAHDLASLDALVALLAGPAVAATFSGATTLPSPTLAAG